MDPDRPKRPSNTVLNLCRCESLESGGVSTRTLLCFYDATCYLQVQLLTSYEGKGGQTGVFEAGWGRGGGTDTSHQGLYRIIFVCLCSVQCLLLILISPACRCREACLCSRILNFFFFFFLRREKNTKHARKFCKAKGLFVQHVKKQTNTQTHDHDNFVSREKRWP